MFNLYDIHITIIAPTRLHKTQIKSLLYETCHLQSQKKHLERKKDGRRKHSKISILHFHIIRQLCVDICLGKKT